MGRDGQREVCNPGRTEGEQHESGHEDDNDEPPGVSCNWWLRVVLRVDDLIVG